MIKLLAIPALLLMTLFAPIAPTPAVLHFQPGVSIDIALDLTEELDGQLIATTWIDTATQQQWYGSTVWANRHRITYRPDETMTAIHLNGLGSVDLTRLEQNPLIDSIETVSAPWVNLAFFLNQLQKITGRP